MTLSIPSDVESLLANGMIHELIRQFESGGVTYFLIDQFDNETGSEVIVAGAVRDVVGIEEGVVSGC
jgi:hypothetical protein